VQTSLAAHAELIPTDRLLDLIDQFAAAEGRMKWAPNKKLHFEVAIIRAIQTLGQATLDEVIQKLGELRDDGGAVAAGGDRGQKRSRPQNAGVNATGYSAPRAEEQAVTVNAEKTWQGVLAKIPAKGLLRTLTDLVRPIGIDGRNFLLGHSPDDKAQVEVVATVNNRRHLEKLLNEASGRDWSVKFVAKDGIPPSDGVVSDTAKSTESFKDDPLIQQAIELFKAEVRS
jgi:hypothetical protein